MKNTVTTPDIQSKQGKLPKSISSLLGSVGISFMALITPVQADGKVDNYTVISGQKTPDISRLGSPLVSSGDSITFMWRNLSSLYETADTQGRVTKSDIFSLYNGYVSHQGRISPSVSQYMSEFILGLLYSLLDNGYTVEGHTDLEKITSIIASLEGDTYTFSYGENMPLNPLFSETIHIVGKKEGQKIFIDEKKGSKPSTNPDTTVLPSNSHKVLATMMQLILVDLGTPRQQALKKYIDYSARVKKLESNLRSKDRTIQLTQDEIKELGYQITDLESEMISVKNQAETDIQQAKKDKDSYYTTEIANANAHHAEEIASKNILLQEQQDKGDSLSSEIEGHKQNISGFYAAIPRDMPIKNSGNLETDTNQLLSILFANFEKQIADIRKEYKGIIENKDAEIQVLAEEVSSLQGQLTTSDIALTENAKLKTANEKLTSTNSDLQKQVETLDAARSSGVEQLNEAIATKIETERENTELIGNNEELLKQIEAYKKKISELQGNNSKLKEELGETKDALDSVVAAKIDID